MFSLLWLRQLQRHWFPRRPIRQKPFVLRRVRLCLEGLEDRVVPAVFNVGAGDVAALIADINTANSNGDPSNTINLTQSTYNLTTINNFWYGPDGLPAISSNLTINGNGATIQRAGDAKNFRLFYVSGGQSGLAAGNLTLNNLTLQGGVADGGDSGTGGGGLGAGGAIFNQGTVNLTGVTLTNDAAVGGSSGVSGLGGGGGGMGANATGDNGGGFGGALTGGPFGGNGAFGSSGGGAGGGGGFRSGDNGQGSLNGFAGGVGGGQGGFGGNGGGGFGGGGGLGGDGGGGGGSSSQGASFAGNGGNFGNGGLAGGGVGGGGGGIGGGGGASGGVGTGFGGGGGGFGGGGGNGGGIGSGGGGGGFGGGGGGGLGAAGFGGGSASGGDVGNHGGGGAGLGGALFNMFGTTTLTNCTLTADSAQGGNGDGTFGGGGSGFGGAVFNLDGTLNLTFCTLANNTVAGGTGSTKGNAAGGDVYNLAFGNKIADGSAQTATTTITDSILANSTGGVDLVNNAVNGKATNTATVTLNGPNLVMSSTGTIGGTPLTANPQLGALQNNGGPTPTMAIPSSSPAFQAGMSVAGITTDQRGQPRPGTPSLGAFEPQSAPPSPPAAASIQFTSIAVTPNLSAFNQTETVSVHASQSGGTVAFVLDGQNVQAAVDANGNATVSVTLPILTMFFPHSISAAYTNGDATANAATTTSWFQVNVLLFLQFNVLLPTIDTFLANGSQIVRFFFAGNPLLFVTFTASGQLTGFGLGAG